MPHTPFLGIFTSTNSYLELAETPEAAMDAEVASFMQNIRSRHSFRVPIQMDLKVAFGTSMFLQGTPYANGDKILMAYSSSDLGEAKLLGIAVKGADAVVTVGGIGNNVCQVAFDKHVRPVWAKTNGVAITPIPTNCVYSFETVSNRVVRSLIY